MEQPNYKQRIAEMTNLEYAKAYFDLEEYVEEFQVAFRNSFKHRAALVAVMEEVAKLPDLDTSQRVEQTMERYSQLSKEALAQGRAPQTRSRKGHKSDSSNELGDLTDDDLYTLNGCGTIHAGRFNRSGDTYDTICWISLLFIPLIPYKAYRVTVVRKVLFFHTSFVIEYEQRLKWSRVLYVYLRTALILALLYAIYYYNDIGFFDSLLSDSETCDTAVYNEDENIENEEPLTDEEGYDDEMTSEDHNIDNRNEYYY